MGPLGGVRSRKSCLVWGRGSGAFGKSLVVPHGMQRCCNVPVSRLTLSSKFTTLNSFQGVIMTVYANPNTEGSLVNFKSRYEHYIGGQWVAPVKGQYFENITPITGKGFCEVGRGTAEDI